MSDYDNFVEDYNNPDITAHDVRRINNLNSKQYCNLRKLAIRNGDIPAVRHMNRNYNNGKYYTEKENGVFEVQKSIDGEKLYVGKFPNENIAKQVVKECIKHNWQINEIKPFIDEYKVKPKNYTLVNGYYIIQKVIKGKNTVFAIIREDKVSVDVVECIVAEFRKVHWNMSCKDSILRLFNIN